MAVAPLLLLLAGQGLADAAVQEVGSTSAFSATGCAAVDDSCSTTSMLLLLPQLRGWTGCWAAPCREACAAG